MSLKYAGPPLVLIGEAPLGVAEGSGVFSASELVRPLLSRVGGNFSCLVRGAHFYSAQPRVLARQAIAPSRPPCPLPSARFIFFAFC